jgi:hypothetical protein
MLNKIAAQPYPNQEFKNIKKICYKPLLLEDNFSMNEIKLRMNEIKVLIFYFRKNNLKY